MRQTDVLIVSAGMAGLMAAHALHRQGLHATLAKRLAQGLDVRVNVRLASVALSQNGWQARDENGRLFTGRTRAPVKG